MGLSPLDEQPYSIYSGVRGSTKKRGKRVQWQQRQQELPLSQDLSTL